MKKTFLAAALLAAGLLGTAQAALVTVPFQYKVNFSDATVSTELGLSTGSVFSGTATFDDAIAAIDGLYTASSFSLTFGSFSFNETNDISGFGVGIGVGPTNNLTALYFETLFNLVSAPAAGEYLLSFRGNEGVLTPSGDTFDYKLTSTVVPVPAALPLLAAGLGALGFMARRRRAD